STSVAPLTPRSRSLSSAMAASSSNTTVTSLSAAPVALISSSTARRSASTCGKRDVSSTISTVGIDLTCLAASHLLAGPDAGSLRPRTSRAQAPDLLCIGVTDAAVQHCCEHTFEGRGYYLEVIEVERALRELLLLTTLVEQPVDQRPDGGRAWVFESARRR